MPPIISTAQFEPSFVAGMSNGGEVDGLSYYRRPLKLPKEGAKKHAVLKKGRRKRHLRRRSAMKTPKK